MKALVAGWFSFEGMGATAGDLMARDVVCRWLADSGVPYDIATAPPFSGGIAWQAASPPAYTHLIFVCGPFGNGEPITSFLEHFRSCKLIGIDLSMLQSLDDWNPFDLLLERDSQRTSRPDLSLLADVVHVPVIGRVLVHPQSEYRDRGRHEQVHHHILEMLSSIEAAIIPIDTRLDSNAGGLRTPREIDSLIARMDVVVTTRLHGIVLALRNGVPAVVVDPIEGGAKITRQAEVLRWPVLSSDACDAAALFGAYEYCLTEEARAKARSVAQEGRTRLAETQREFVSFMTGQSE